MYTFQTILGEEDQDLWHPYQFIIQIRVRVLRFNFREFNLTS